MQADHLGTPRLKTHSDGNPFSRDHYEPFGRAMNVSNDTIKYKFTGKERDGESGLDYFGARYYTSTLGRFLTVDPADDSELSDPQRWNKYSYVRNNPVKHVDPNGEALETPWDVLNVALGTASAGINIASGNYVGAAIDVLGIAYDSFATVVPGLPAGASTAINVSRFVKVSRSVVGSAEKLGKVFQNNQTVNILVKKITNNIEVHLTPMDLAGAVKDILGNPVTKGGRVFDHLNEVENGLKGLKNAAIEIKRLLARNDLSAAQRGALQEALSKVSKHINRVQKVLKAASDLAKTK